ncbi:hypothetical protein [Taklimakanibacter lacteus]|uniref:hypothetical protein n=1 Tax=Taklimakanibacter lacteus TaxID=2268456 RepID=UPI0013C4CCD9
MKIASALVLSAAAGFFGSAVASAADMEPPVEPGLVPAGLIDGYVGYRSTTSTDYVHTDGLTYGGAARFSLPLFDIFSIQGDAQGEWYDDIDDSWEPTEAWALGGHISVRDPELGLIGAFAAYSNGDGVDEHNGPPTHSLVVGGEFQYYLDDLTLYVQAGYADIIYDSGEPEGFVDGWFVRGVGRYFLGDDTRLQAEISYGETSQFVDAEDDGEITNWEVELRTGFGFDMPLYGFIGYRGGYYDATTEEDDGEEHVGFVGLSFLFGADSLRHNDRYGATLDLPMLPARAAPWAEGLD